MEKLLLVCALSAIAIVPATASAAAPARRHRYGVGAAPTGGEMLWSPDTMARTSVSGRRICRLANDAADAPDAEAALRTLTQLRDELDEFERQQVARALTAGRSFASVAQALSISRQAAHRRFRDLAPPRRRRRSDQLSASAEVRLVFKYARSEALAVRAPVLEPQHVVLGILRNGDRHAAAALVAAGVTLEAARHEAALAAAGVRRGWRSPGHAGDDAAGGVRRLLREAVRFARAEDAADLRVEHLLRGVLDQEDWAWFLHRLGVQAPGVLAALDESPGEVRVHRAPAPTGAG